jgi:hypothetical protein
MKNNNINNINNPKSNNIWNIMKNIQTTYYYLDKFERVSENTFIENNTELTKIGYEMFDNFGLENIKINFFVDICAAPGMYSKIIFDKGQPTGIGISLPPEKGGVKFEFNDSKYKQFYKDILDKEYKLDLPRKLDFGIASCVSYVDNIKDAHNLNMVLILTSLNLILNNLIEGGNLIINASMKNIYTCYNIIYLLLKKFTKVKLWKSSTVWGTKNTFYIFCYNNTSNISNNNIDDIKIYINEVKNNNSKFNNNFIGDTKNFEKITTMMNDIYITRINCWLELIKNS